MNRQIIKNAMLILPGATAEGSAVIEDGRIGKVLEIRARGKEDKRGGGEDLWVLGSHLLDMMADLGGAPKWCEAAVTLGGKAITKAMESSGLKANFINGLRVTDEATVAIVKRTLDEIVNKDVCDAIITAKGKPKGLAGDSVLVCQKLTTDDDGNTVDLGFVGEVTEVKVKLIKKEIAEGNIPVISPVAEGYDGKPYNVNADLVAGRVASALRARRLVYMSDVPGLLSAPPDASTLISTLKISQVEALKARGVIDKGMRPKVGSAVRALAEGVQRVHFIDGRLPHSLLLEIFTDKGIGTEIVHG